MAGVAIADCEAAGAAVASLVEEVAGGSGTEAVATTEALVVASITGAGLGAGAVVGVGGAGAGVSTGPAATAWKLSKGSWKPAPVRRPITLGACFSLILPGPELFTACFRAAAIVVRVGLATSLAPDFAPVLPWPREPRGMHSRVAGSDSMSSYISSRLTSPHDSP